MSILPSPLATNFHPISLSIDEDERSCCPNFAISQTQNFERSFYLPGINHAFCELSRACLNIKSTYPCLRNVFHLVTSIFPASLSETPFPQNTPSSGSRHRIFAACGRNIRRWSTTICTQMYALCKSTLLCNFFWQWVHVCTWRLRNLASPYLRILPVELDELQVRRNNRDSEKFEILHFILQSFNYSHLNACICM